MARPRDAHGRFLPSSATPAGPKPARPRKPAGGKRKPRRRGSAKPSEAFLADLLESWAIHGAATIEEVRDKRPHDYLRLMAASFPKPPVPEAPADPTEAMSDEEVADDLRRILGLLAAAGVDLRG